MSFILDVIQDKRRESRHEQRAADHEARVETLLTTPEFSPLNWINFSEAMNETNKRQLEDLVRLLEEQRFEEAGRTLVDITTSYWRRAASDAASLHN